MLRVHFDDEAFGLDVARYRSESPARAVAEEVRELLSREGVPRDLLEACAPDGRDGTRLGGRLKLYLPLGAGERPFRMVFTPIVCEEAPELVYLAFGVAHQPRGSRAPTVYAIAHHRLHGTWPRSA